MQILKWLTIVAIGSMPMCGSILYTVTDSWIDANLGAQTASASVSVPDYFRGAQLFQCESCEAGPILTINDNLYIWGVQFATSPSSFSATILLRDRQFNTPGFTITSSFAGVTPDSPGTYTVNNFISSNLDGLPLFSSSERSSTLVINPEPSTAGLAAFASLCAIGVACTARRRKATSSLSSLG